MNTIQKLLKDFENVGLYASTLNGNKKVVFNEHKTFFTASTSKVITAIALYHKLEKEKIKDTKLLSFTENDKVGGSGIIKLMYPDELPIFNLVVLMLTISDNTAADLLFNYVTKKYQAEIIELLGLKNTHLRQTNLEVVNGEFNLSKDATYESWERENKERNNTPHTNAVSLNVLKGNVSTPHDFFLVLKELTDPKIISRESARKILHVMKYCYRKNFFYDFGLQTDIAHKTGGIPSVRTDVGIVFGANPFYFIMMAKDISSLDEAMQRGKKINQLVFEYFNNND